MYALCVSGAVNTQGLVWKFLFYFYALYINFHLFIHSFFTVIKNDFTSHNNVFSLLNELVSQRVTIRGKTDTVLLMLLLLLLDASADRSYSI